ncbi:glycoside hydrolase [Amylostereum chailletii]|nr:glycoside hydrolase [Amylostereum chailletii]
MVSSSPSYELVASSDDLSPAPPPRPHPYKKSSVPKVLALLVAFCLVALASYRIGQSSVLNHPSSAQAEEKIEDVHNPPDVVNEDITRPATNSTEIDMSGGKHSVGYFVNWGIYGRKYPPSSIPVQDLTHILYAFANVRAETGEVFLSDLWADQDIHYPGDSWNDGGTNLYGNFKAIYNLKKQNRHLKLLLSIGGWTYSPSFHPVVVSPSHRAEFVRSSVKLVEDYGLDGLDVDYEYPQNDAQARGYVELLRELRYALDEHARRKNANYRFLLTIAAPCGPDNYQKLHVREMDQSLDFWNMMAYDFSGSWDKIAHHQANVYGGPISASQAIGWYISQGLPRHKIIMGIPLYGRSFLNTEGPGSPFNGLGPGSWETGVYDYRALPLPGSYVLRDDKALASWTYDYQKKELVSFDDEQVGWWKGDWIRREGLGGSMFWELSGDKGGTREGMEGGLGKEPQPGRSLVQVVKEAMGGLDTTKQNWLQYEGSKFENLRNGMP